MNLIKSSCQFIQDNSPIKKIELAGRTCYKSDSNYTDDTALKFYNAMTNSHHYAMLEHGEQTFSVCPVHSIDEIDSKYLSIPYIRWTYHPDLQKLYITLSCSHIEQPLSNFNVDRLEESTAELHSAMCELFHEMYTILSDDTSYDIHSGKYTIHLVKDILNESEIDENDIMIHKSFTFRFICDRGVSHELVRHRCSVAQESQRYCGYSKEKFGSQITYIQPHDYDNWTADEKYQFVEALKQAEKSYIALSCLGKQPQQARAVLPNATKTEVVLTMPVYRWKHFINLRSIGTTGTPHPDMKVLADQVKLIFDKEVNSMIDIRKVISK